MEMNEIAQTFPVSAWLGPISHLIGWVGKVAPFTVRFYYTEQKLSSLLLLDIPSRGEGACYSFSTQEGRCWILVTNLSPFDFTVERMRVSVTVDGGSFVCSLVLPKQIKAGSRETVLVKDKCPVPEAAISLMKNSKGARIEIEFVAASKIRSISELRHISDMRNLEII